MNNRDVVLAALAIGKGAIHSPVQIQKLLFLLDRKFMKELGGPHFEFEPYDYGPFDRKVYDVLEQLESEGWVEIMKAPGLRWKRYRTTLEGQRRGEDILNSLKPELVEKITTLSNIVRRLSFADLVSAIYKAYPEMKINSVFQG
jgi:hypothetical protein